MRAGAVLGAGTPAESRAWRTCVPLLKDAADVSEAITVETLTSVSTATRAFVILADISQSPLFSGVEASCLDANR